MAKNIDLGSLNAPAVKKSDNPAKKPESAPVGEMGLVLSGNKVAAPPADRGMAALNDQHQKLIYLIDRSGSSADIVAGPEAIAAYTWDPPTMARLERLVADAVAEMEAAEQAAMAAMGDDDPDEEVEDEIVDIPTVSPQVQQLAAMKGLTGEALKIEFIKTGLVKAHVMRNYGVINDEITKLGLVKRMLRRMIQERYDKYPNADVSCLTFDTKFEWVPARTLQELIDSISSVTPRGGTHIYGAIETALAACEAHPSRVHLHHFVLVTDGQDYSGKNLPDLLPKFKELGVILDFIFLLQPGDVTAESTAKIIREVVEKTGGIYKEVAGSAEFETVFIEASNRKLIAAGS